MEHDAFVAAIREQSERFLEAVALVPPDAEVPSCPGWSVTDLLWHLAEVQHHWAQVAGSGVAGDDVVPPDRSDDPAELRALVATAGTELLRALSGRDPATPCWSWHPEGGTLGWVARRQAHEALVHRVDAELAAGLDVRPPSVELAEDGIDEVLTVFVSGVPAWGAFAADGTTVRIECTNAPGAWLLRLGRFAGTGPDSGKEYDLDAADVVRLADGDRPDADLVVAGHAWDVDRWIWGRGPADVVVTGPAALEARLRSLLVEATQ